MRTLESLLTIYLEIYGKPIQKQLVSAMLIGTSVAVPDGKTVGCTFQSIPLCTALSETGCVVMLASFRATVPPSANSLFGRARGEGQVAGCTNPAALGGGKATLDSYMSTVGEISLSRKDYPEWTHPPKKIQTPFVSLPGLLQSECMHRGEFSYLEISLNADSKRGTHARHHRRHLRQRSNQHGLGTPSRRHEHDDGQLTGRRGQARSGVFEEKIERRFATPLSGPASGEAPGRENSSRRLFATTI